MIEKKMKESMEKAGVTKIVGFYLSMLEHDWILIVEAENAHECRRSASTPASLRLTPSR